MNRGTLPLAVGLAAAAVSAAVAQDSTIVRPDVSISVRVEADTTPAADEIGAGASSRFDASPPLPEEHWAARAALRAEMMGLAPGYFPAQRSVPRHAVAAALEEAVRSAEGRPAVEALARGWWARFVEEFPEYGAAAASAVVRLGGAVGAAVESDDGLLAPARGLFGVRQPPAALPDRSGWAALARAGVGSRHFSAAADAVARDGGVHAPRWDVVVGIGAFALSAGRGGAGYGPGAGGGVVFSGTRPLGRIEAQTTRPLRPGGLLKPLGSVTLHTFLSRLDEARHPGEPYLWGARVGVRPHARLTLGINRGAVFGGDRPVTAASLGKLLIGVLTTDENQMVSVDARWRLPTERAVPLVAYAEWGADDAAGAWAQVPGQVFGIAVPALPGAPEAALGVEHARFAGPCCGNGPWYYHNVYRGNWVARGAPLGHPLAGQGSETRIYGRADLAGSRLRLDAAGFVRRRADAGPPPGFAAGGNLLAPDRAGRSTGVSVEAAARPAAPAEVRVRALGERGDGWSERRLEALVALFF